MPERQWTTAQQHCIHARGGSLLVSAAAGSGKTSVLVERVVNRISDQTNPVDIDRLLIVTFTRAAAAEMKQRLSARLSQCLAEHPDDRRLERQQMLLPTAAISTIDGFCTAFLRENFEAAGLSPRFRVIEGGDETLMRGEALEETLEVFYAAAEEHFLKLSDLLNGRRDDSGLKNAVLSTYDFIQAQAYPTQWLREHIFPADPDAPLSETGWGQVIRRFTAQKLGFLAGVAAKAAAPLREIEDADAYAAHLMGDVAVLERTALTVSDPDNDWDRCIRALEAAIPGNLPRAKGLPSDRTDAVKDAWAMVRKELRDTLLPLFGDSEQILRRDLLNTRPQLFVLCDLIEAFSLRYGQKKAQKQLLDFSDLEHLTLTLLRDPATGMPTPLAQELSRRYTEILVDEYQDTNEVQDTIFRMLSCPENTQFFVGDVKQSIYGFRQAMPEIFMQKKDAFSPFDGVSFPAYITLGENFRSRPEVTGTANFLFQQLMTKHFCGIDYTDGEELLAAAPYPANDGAATECLLLDHAYGEREVSVNRSEAQLIAVRIRELMTSGQVTENGVLRPVQHRDICILLRSRSTHAAVYADELRAQGIPVHIDTGAPFFEAPVVQTALSLLRSIDNPLRDVSLMALLLSPIGGFTADDCAALRVLAREHGGDRSPALYAALTLAAGHAEDAALGKKADNMVARLRHFRRLSVSLPADELLRRLFDETALLSAAAAGPDGKQRVSDLRQLMQYARSYEQNGFRGLSAFVRYLDRLENDKRDLSAAPPGVGSDAVSLMTIHASKGLEFPIVFLTHLFGEFHRETGRQPLVLHGAAGAALSGYDDEQMTAFRTVSQNGVQLAMRYTALAEELRVLYVAMTRAREKLIAVFVKKHLPARLKKLASFLPDAPVIDTPRLLTMQSLGDWMLSALLRHPDAVLLRELAGDPDIPVLMEQSPLVCRLMTPDELTAVPPDEPNAAAMPDPHLLEALQKRLNFRYPFAPLQAVPAKLAASELAHRKQALDFVASRRPAFLSADGLTPAERGTALHTFMQFADYAAAAADPAEEADRLLAEGFLSQVQRDALSMNKIRSFFAGPLYARMLAAHRLWREYAFTAPMPAGDFDPALPAPVADEHIVIQGIADCVFEENGALVIVDYKTDRIKDPAALAVRYQKQLDLYRQALTETLGLPVKETLLYSFYLNQTVVV